MRVYRLSGEKYKNDISGKGASKQHGNRWNSYGTSMLYTSESRALCAVELHKVFPPNLPILNYFLLEIYVPKCEVLQIDSSFFKKDEWVTNLSITQQLGDYFINQKEFLIMKVPSVWIENCFNYLINPLHKDFRKVKISSVSPFPMSGKLF